MRLLLRTLLALLLSVTIAGAARAAVTSANYLALISGGSVLGVTHAYDVGNALSAGTDLVGGSNLTQTGSGTSGVAITPYVAGYQPGGGSFYGATISAWQAFPGAWGWGVWIKGTTTGSDQYIVHSGTTSLKLQATTGNVVFTVGTAMTVISSAHNYGDGAAHFIFVSAQGNNCGLAGSGPSIMFIDGVSDGLCAGAASPAAAPQALAVSAQTSGALPFNGVVGMFETWTFSVTAFKPGNFTAAQAMQRYKCGLSNTQCGLTPTVCTGPGKLIWCDNFDSYTPYASLTSPWAPSAGTWTTSPYAVESNYLGLVAFASSSNATRSLGSTPLDAAIDFYWYPIDPSCSSCNWTAASVGFLRSDGQVVGFKYGANCSASAGFVGLQLVVAGSNVGSCFLMTSNTIHEMNLRVLLDVTAGKITLKVDKVVQATFTGTTRGAGQTLTDVKILSAAQGGSPTALAESIFDNFGAYLPPYDDDSGPSLIQ